MSSIFGAFNIPFKNGTGGIDGGVGSGGGVGIGSGGGGGVGGGIGGGGGGCLNVDFGYDVSSGFSQDSSLHNGVSGSPATPTTKPLE